MFMSRSILPICSAAALLLLPSIASAGIVTALFKGISVDIDGYDDATIGDTVIDLLAGDMTGPSLELPIISTFQTYS
jgi:hypothetical protein